MCQSRRRKPLRQILRDGIERQQRRTQNRRQRG